MKRFGAAKGRLGDAFAPGTRRALAEAMVTDVLVALRRATSIDDVVVVTAEPAAEALARGYGARVVPDREESGQSAATLVGLRAVARAERALLVPGDCPALDPAQVDALVASAGPGPEVVIVPDRHGTGTNALLLTPPHALEPAFGPGSRARHERVAQAERLEARIAEVPSLVLDVDTPDDLEALREALEADWGEVPD